MEHTLLDLVARFGYLVVFLGVGIESMGIPVPGETSLLVGAVLAGRGNLSAIVVALAGLAGAVSGDNLGYWFGRRWGSRIIRLPILRSVYTAERVLAAERIMECRGWIAVFFGRFVALLRILAGPLAGMHRMPWRTFVVANAAGGAVWVGAVVAVGLLIGSNLDHAVTLVRRAGFAALGLVLAAAIVAAVWQWRRHRAGSRASRL